MNLIRNQQRFIVDITTVNSGIKNKVEGFEIELGSTSKCEDIV